MKKQDEIGITLIALVITVIVLLILAGITINLTIGQDGVLRRAEEAGKNYTNAAEYERNQLAEFLNETDKIIANVTSGGTSTGNGNNHPTIPAFGTIIRTENNVNYTADGEGNEIPVPEGFTAVTGTKETGFVIKDITTNAEGTPTDTNGNEFVWVPCTIDGANGSIKYDRYAFLSSQPADGTDDVTNSTKIKHSSSGSYVYTEAMPSDEEASIRTYGGFYIGRYESGVTGYDASVSKSNSSSLTEWTGYSNGKLVVKSGQQVWNYITRDKAKKVSEELYSKTKGDSVNSRLCSSYAWDTALKFIETKYPTYPTDSVGGYYGQSAPTTTGYDTTHPCNIYDMGGNVWEWTNESYSYESGTCTHRGGAYNCSSSGNPAAYRSYGSTTGANNDLSFRTTLYL